MSKPSIKINAQLYSILQDENFDNFSVTRLRDAYLAMSSTIEEPIEARKYVYRQIHRLVKKGLLLKKGTKNSKRIVYQKSELFFETKFIVQNTTAATANQNTSAPSTTNHAIRQLEERLKESEVDLLTSIGESEEYMRLYQSFPEMKAHLESQYLQARERSSKLLGQIKAIKSVLSHQRK
ncbi:response regulator [Shewanella sp. JBTF-M18]|uniref:Response regulator n=1 Tax=Shewanella insulae TaxID=2681496 RepID=A0A6L7HZL4_9GAMM|nr:response regulator [Shewanella insulae]MXR69573.1 response regulator [Shewanella insulae]